MARNWSAVAPVGKAVLTMSAPSSAAARTVKPMFSRV